MENKEPMSFRDAVLCIIFFGLFCYFMLNGYYLFLAVFPAISAVMLCRDWENTVAKLKWTWTTFIVSTLTLFIGRIFAVHHYNNKYGIYPEYLNYSVSVWALITAITVFIFFPLGYWAFIFAKRTWDNNTFFNLLVNLSHCATCMLIWIAISYAYPYAKQYDAHLLILDSYTHSDCRPPAGATAIRKNDKECYQISWHQESGLELTEYPSPKP